MAATQTLGAVPFSSTTSIQTNLWEEVPCNLCGSKNYQVKYQGTTDPDTTELLKSFSASSNFISQETLVRCLDCDLIYTTPRLRSDFILRSYTEAEDPTYVSQAEGRILSFKTCLKSVEKFRRSGSILDIGAAAGFFLKVAKDRGWKVYGIEPSKYLSEFGNQNYQVNIKCGTIETASQDLPKMDVVTLWDVLEHTLDPTDVLKRCNRLLAENGLIVINYPNIGNWMARLAGRKYWFILSVHLYYFVPSTIKKMLSKTGFEVIESRPHFQWLELGYLIYRLEAYLPGLARVLGKFIKSVGLSRKLIPYFAAQTRVIAKKVKPV